MARRYLTPASFPILILAIALLLVPACKLPDGQVTPSTGNQLIDHKPTNNKMDNDLEGLVAANQVGQAESYAYQHAVQLISDNVNPKNYRVRYK